MASEHAKCLKSLGQNITGVISRPDSNSLDKFKSTFDIDHIFLNAEDALEKINAGASLIQLYTGFVYEGPSLVKRINKALLER